MNIATKNEEMLQKLFLNEQFKKLQKLQDILLEIKQPIKLLHWVNQKKKKLSRRNLQSARRNLLATTSYDTDLLRIATKKWIEVDDQSGGNYNVDKEIRIKAPMLRPDICDYSDAYIVVKGNITVTSPNNT